MIFCAACLSIGQFIWKIMPGYNLYYLFGGFLVLSFGAVSMILAYRYGELSVLMPINSVNFIFAAFISVFFLREDLSLLKIFGNFLIITGVIFISRSRR